jgi:hypothetical protein
MESVWLESDFDGMIVGDAGHKLWMRDIFFKVAHITVPQGISVNNSAEVRGTRVYIDITSGPGPIGVSINDTGVVELFDSGIWVDPAAPFPTTINLPSATAKMRLVNAEFERTLVRGSTQHIAHLFSPLRPNLLGSAIIDALTSQTQFTLTTGPPDDNALNGRLIVITDNADGRRKAVGVVSSYIGSTRAVTLTMNPGIFSIGAGDQADIVVEAP